MNDSELIVARIENAVFHPVRGTAGYDMKQVDDFLEGLVVAVRQGRSVDALIDVVRFMPTRFREGYDMAEVDGFLEEIKAFSLGEPPPSDQDQSGEAVPVQPVLPESYAAAGGVVQEQKGFFARLFGR